MDKDVDFETICSTLQLIYLYSIMFYWNMLYLPSTAQEIPYHLPSHLSLPLASTPPLRIVLFTEKS